MHREAFPTRRYCLFLLVQVTIICGIGWLLANYSTHLHARLNYEAARQQEARRSIHVAVFTIGLGLPYFDLALRMAGKVQENLCVPSSTDLRVTVDTIIFSNHDYDDLEGVAEADNSALKVDRSRVELVKKAKVGWPQDSMARYQFMKDYIDDRQKKVLAQEDARRRGLSVDETPLYTYSHYIWTDADNHFWSPVCEDLLGTLVGAIHPRFHSHCANNFPFENRPNSTAAVPPNIDPVFPYYSAHIVAGKAAEFYKMCDTLAQNMEEDRKNGISARVEDESHLNAYFFRHTPTVTLSRAFTYPSEYLQNGYALNDPNPLNLNRIDRVYGSAVFEPGKWRGRDSD